MPKLGIVGLGVIFDYQLKALKNLVEYKIAGLCDSKINSLKLNLDGLSDLIFYENYKDLLKSDCDSILISVPLPAHFNIAKDALKSGKNVLLEKPAVLSINELEELYKIANDNNVVFHIAYHASFARDLQWFLGEKDKFVETFGRIVSISQEFFDPYMSPHLMKDKVLALGDSWIDSGINALSVVDRIISLENARVLKTTFKKTDSIITKMKSILTTQGDKPIVLKIHTDWMLGLNYKMTEVFFENGSMIELNHSNQSVYLYDTPGKKTLYCFSENERLVEHYKGVFKDFSCALNSKNSNKEKSKILHELLFNIAKTYETK